MQALRKPIDWTVREDFETLFPAYRREQIRLDKAGQPRSKEVELNKFSLKNPFGTADLFLNTKLSIEANKRCAIFGVNGSGKTCLFEAISSGEIAGFPNYMSIHHMKELEHDEAKDAVSVLDTVLTSNTYRNVLIHCQQKIEEEMAKVGEEDARYAKLKSNLDYVMGQKLLVHGDNANQIATGMLRVLGFDEVGERAPLSSLSGGLRMRVALACAFFINPDILLLDEPTNHLDLPSVLWLENKLRGYKGSFLLVTHDRTLLENVVTSVMLIQDFKLENYPVGFKEFEIKKEQNDKFRERQVEDFMKYNRNIDPNNPKYKIKQAYEKWLTARYEKNIMLESKFAFSTPAPLTYPVDQTTTTTTTTTTSPSQKDICLIKVEDLRFSYEPATLPYIFDEPVNYEIKVGTRVGIMGPNGAGKSTFLKLITEKLVPTSGRVIVHPEEFVTAYFGQHSTKELNLDSSAIDFMKLKFPKANVGVLRNHLAKTSVGDSIVETRMRNLSFSQRSCVIFAALTFVPPHLLIMDEPTNFLDLESVDSLIKAVNKFQGGLVVVTHNRDFLKKTANRFLSIIPGAFLEFDTVKDAENATYSFISALQNGQYVDVQSAIRENRGGGALLTSEDLALRQARLEQQQQKSLQSQLSQQEEEEKERLAKLEKEKERLAKLEKLKVDWAVGEEVWVPEKGSGKYVKATVLRNTPMGVSCKLEKSGEMLLITDKKKLREENPDLKLAEKVATGAAAPEDAAKAGRGGGRGGARGRGGRGGAAPKSSGGNAKGAAVVGGGAVVGGAAKGSAGNGRGGAGGRGGGRGRGK